MNLTNLGVQEMNAQELLSIEGGGFFRDLGYVIGYTLAYTAGLIIYTVGEAIKIVID